MSTAFLVFITLSPLAKKKKRKKFWLPCIKHNNFQINKEEEKRRIKIKFLTVSFFDHPPSSFLFASFEHGLIYCLKDAFPS